MLFTFINSLFSISLKIQYNEISKLLFLVQFLCGVIIALIAIYLIINSGRIYIQRRDFSASFECLKILHIYITPVKKNIRYILEEIYNSKKKITFLW